MQELCTHCHTPTNIKVPHHHINGLIFCCLGCQTVYQYLNKNDLLRYYDLKENENIQSSPIPHKKNDFSHMDQQEFLTAFEKKDSHGHKYLELYLEGVHCTACLWLIEKIPDFLSGVLKVTLNMSTSQALIYLKEEGHYTKVAKTLDSFGYRPHPIGQDKEREKWQRKEERADLLKIGIAGAFFGNIMLLSISIYGGVGGPWLEIFRWLTFILALPVLLFSASSFYKNALGSLKQKTISIDLPIALALIIGTFTGLLQLLNKRGELYFDSLTALVFLLLLARYLLKKAQQSGLSPDGLSSIYQNSAVYRQTATAGHFEAIHPQFIKKKDIIKLAGGSYFPADGYLLSQKTYSDLSLLTGEGRPVTLQKGDLVYQGTRNLGAEILMEVSKTGTKTKLGEIIQEVKKGWLQRPKLLQKTDMIAKYFVATVLFLALATIVFFATKGEISTGFDRALALIIVTCPCALGLAAPLALLNSLKKAAQKGIIIKNENIIENLTKIKHLFLDKTGTLTMGIFTVARWKNIKTTQLPIQNIVYSLEKYSQHPIATSLREYLEQLPSFNKESEYSVEAFRDNPGLGIAGLIKKNYYEIKRIHQREDQKCSTIGVFENHRHVTTIELQDQIRRDAVQTIHGLKKYIQGISILSGDHQYKVDQIMSELGLEKSQGFGELTPLAKKAIICRAQHSLMVGDGANDAPALGHATVGVAVKGSVDISLRAADVYLTKSGPGAVLELLQLAHETLKVIYRNLFFSLFYNVLGATLALYGAISPLAAAILMPLSSFTVLASSFIGTKKMRGIL